MRKLTKKQVREIIKALDECRYEATNDGPGMPDGMKVTQISVEDYDGEPVKVRAMYIGDGPQFGVPNAETLHTIKVLDYTFTGVEEENDSEILWKLKSDSFCLPDDDELIEELTEALDDSRDSVDFESAYSVDSIHDEWSDDELRDLFDSELEHDFYLDIDGEYYGFDGDPDELVEDCDFDEETIKEILEGEHPELTRDELVEILIGEEIDFVY